MNFFYDTFINTISNLAASAVLIGIPFIYAFLKKNFLDLF